MGLADDQRGRWFHCLLMIRPFDSISYIRQTNRLTLVQTGLASLNLATSFLTDAIRAPTDVEPMLTWKEDKGVGRTDSQGTASLHSTCAIPHTTGVPPPLITDVSYHQVFSFIQRLDLAGFGSLLGLLCLLIAAGGATLSLGRSSTRGSHFCWISSLHFHAYQAPKQVEVDLESVVDVCHSTRMSKYLTDQ